MTQGKNIRLYLVDGSPNGLTIAEIMNWTGHVMQTPRSDLADLLQRPEISRTGVYILTGDDPDTPGQLIAYIGESDVIKHRLVQHNRPQDSGGKDFWDKVTVVSSKDSYLTKGHVRYLESRLVEIALRAGRVNLQNQTLPNQASLPEADVADMEYFLEQIKIILPVLGLDLLREVSVVIDPDVGAPGVELKSRRSPIFEIRAKRSPIEALAQEIDNEFVVKAGSRARLEGTGGGNHSYINLRQNLIDQKKLVPEVSGEFLVFAQDTAFKSPSAASAVILGRSDNGRKTWVAKDSGQTYDVWQSSLVADLDVDDE